MSLAPAQLATFKADLTANTATVVVGGTPFPINSDDVLPANHLPPSDEAAQTVAAWYNLPASPAYWVLKPSLSRQTLIEQSGVDTDGSTVTTFAIGGSTGGYIARSQGERDAFDRVLFSQSTVAPMCDPSKANVRTAFDDIFSGAGAGAAGNRAHFRAMSRKKARTCEKLFASATAGGPTQTGNRGAVTNPDTLGADVSGNAITGVTPQDVKDAWTS